MFRIFPEPWQVGNIVPACAPCYETHRESSESRDSNDGEARLHGLHDGGCRSFHRQPALCDGFLASRLRHKFPAPHRHCLYPVVVPRLLVHARRGFRPARRLVTGTCHPRHRHADGILHIRQSGIGCEAFPAFVLQRADGQCRQRGCDCRHHYRIKRGCGLSVRGGSAAIGSATA